jgi:hypothetical protein
MLLAAFCELPLERNLRWRRALADAGMACRPPSNWPAAVGS